jgi:hypothetical protein
MYGYVVCGSVLGAPRTLLCKMVEFADSVIGSGIDLRCVRWCPNSGLSGFGLSVQHVFGVHGRLTSVIDANSSFNGRRLLLVMRLLDMDVAGFRHPEGRCIGKRSRCRCVDLKVIAAGSSVAALTERSRKG